MRYHREDPDSVLIIVGGHGNDYQKICERVHELDDLRIILIRNLSSPLNIVAKSDVFVLSSSYEGLPMSIMEALILHKPVVSTSITSPKEFLEQGYGYLVDDSEEGLYEGMCAYKQGLLDSLKPFDAEKFNEKVLREFENLIEKSDLSACNPLISILMWQTYRFDMTTVFKQGKRYMTVFGDGIVLRMW